MLKTIGISPKVKLPSIALAALGALVVLAGVLLNETAVVSAGGALIAASGISFGVGYSASPGQVGIAQAVKPLEDVLDELEKIKAVGTALTPQLGMAFTTAQPLPLQPQTISASAPETAVPSA